MKGSTPAFRCSRCRHTFELEAEEQQPLPTVQGDEDSAPTAAPAQDQELSFSFPAKQPAHPDVDDRSAAVVSEAPEEQTNSKGIAFEEQWSLVSQETIDAHESRDETPFTLPESTAPAAGDKSFDAPESFHAAGPTLADDEEANGVPNILPMSSYMDQQASILPYLTLFALLVIGFSLAAVITYAHPKRAEALVKTIPLVGTAVLKNSHLKDGILLQSLGGGYQSIQGNREVFIITGVVFNQNPVVIREIQLTGKIHNETGKVLEEQTVWVGNTLSVKILRGMTLEDIPHLQSLKPLKSFEMPPGDSVPFAMVFLKASRVIKDFSCAATFADSDA